jgi:hypothetical protein
VSLLPGTQKADTLQKTIYEKTARGLWLACYMFVTNGKQYMPLWND